LDKLEFSMLVTAGWPEIQLYVGFFMKRLPLWLSIEILLASAYQAGSRFQWIAQ
jgi:hypothetical protein